MKYYKRSAVAAGAAIIAFSIALALTFMTTTSSPLQEGDSIGSNADMIANGKDISKVHTENIIPSVTGFFKAPSAEDGNYPGVIMVHQWWGLNDNIKEMAMQMAAEGHAVLAVDLYIGHIAQDRSQAQSLAGQVRNNP